MSNLLGKAVSAGLIKAVEVLDTLGSSMTSLHLSGGFVAGVTTKQNKISILTYEVANTIVKGSNLMQSLSKENIRHIKQVVLRSEGVQSLISKDIGELQRIVAADKREELKVFCTEVIRFGNLCKDPRYHNLDRYFKKFASELILQKQLKEEVEEIMQQLLTLAHPTAELYHELHALDQDHRRRGDSLAMLWAESKSSKRNVMDKLEHIVCFLHLEIDEAFGSADSNKPVETTSNNREKLGPAGLALHYANIITLIDTLVSHSHSVPPNMRDALYQGLPPNVKSVLVSKLRSFQPSRELTVAQIKAEMEKILQWLVPLATNTIKAHHVFGCVGQWTNTGWEVNRKPALQNDFLKVETLYHADKEKTEHYILNLVVWLHHLVTQSRATTNRGSRPPIKSPIRSPNQ